MADDAILDGLRSDAVVTDDDKGKTVDVVRAADEEVRAQDDEGKTEHEEVHAADGSEVAGSKSWKCFFCPSSASAT